MKVRDTALLLWLPIASCRVYRSMQVPQSEPAPPSGDSRSPDSRSPIDLLKANGAVRSDGGQLTGEAGEEVAVLGYARNGERGAVIQRSLALATCDAVSYWGNEEVDEWVVATGVLSTGVECRAAPDWAPACPYFTLRDCSVKRGPREQDVAPADWEKLRDCRLLGASPMLGQQLELLGSVKVYGTVNILETGPISFMLRGCPVVEDGSLWLATGTLGYRPAWVPTEARGDLTSVSGWLGNGWFTVENCRLGSAQPEGLLGP